MWKAWKVSTVVSVLLDSKNSGWATAELTRVTPVRAQIITVSQNVPVIDTIDCLTGFLVFADAATIGADPIPDSFENNPLAHPNLIAVPTAYPNKELSSVKIPKDHIKMRAPIIRPEQDIICLDIKYMAHASGIKMCPCQKMWTLYPWL